MQDMARMRRFIYTRPLAELGTSAAAVLVIGIAVAFAGPLSGLVFDASSRTALIAAAVGLPLLFAVVASARSWLLALEVARLRAARDKSQHDMASIAHDLKGPLSTVSSYLDLIAEGALGPVNEGTRAAATRASHASSRARSLVESALLQHVEATAMRPCAVETVDLRSLIRDVTEALHTEIAAKHAEVTVEPLPSVLGNQALLFRVFENLVQNAVKYGRPGETPVVLITGGCANGRAEIVVRDRGIGIPTEDCERVFEQAIRADNGQPVALGHGIGLATVRRLVRDQGGEVWVDTTNLDGATLRLSLPLAA